MLIFILGQVQIESPKEREKIRNYFWETEK